MIIRKNKYRNKWTKCKSNHNHQSILEGRYCDYLRLLVKAGEIKSYESQYKFKLWCQGEFVCNHIIDFLIITNDDSKPEVHEVKGIELPDWKIKKKLFEINYPKISYKVIKKGDF